MGHKILIVDDEPDMLSTCKAALSGMEVAVALESKAPIALERLKGEIFDLVVADIRMPNLSGIDLLKAAKSVAADLPVILMTAYPDVESAIEALRAGALDYLIKPFHPEDFQFKIRRALEERRLKGENRLLIRHVRKDYRSEEIVGRSPDICKVLDLVDKAAGAPADVFLLGESGTGKELIAKRLHAKSGRKGHFVPVDCGAIPEHLLENEFFGHEKGAYTDASDARPGLLEFAHLGTFFLDEVCELPLSLQAKLLRVLQERQLRRVGSNSLIDVEVRIVAATNRNVEREVQEGRFREELYYRLNVISISIPPLRERKEDIPLLAEHYLRNFAQEFGKDIRTLSPEALEIMLRYPWPGNVRELQNALKQAIVQCGGAALGADHLPERLVANSTGEDGCESRFSEFRKRKLNSVEKEYFESLLKQANGDVKTAAAVSGLPLSSFYWHLKKHNINQQSFR